MKSALRSLAIATLVVLMCLGVAWLYLKSKAASQAPKQPVTTTYFDGADKVMLFARITDLSSTDLKSLNPKFGYWVDTQITKDGKTVVVAERELPNPNYNPESAVRSVETQLKNLSIRYLNWTDVLKSKPEARLLEDLINADSTRRFIISVVDYAPGADVILSELISKLKADERIILHCEQDGLLSDLRKIEPMWVYGTSRAQVVQTLWLSTIGLQGISPLKGDVLITQYRAGETNQKALLLTPELLAEARRRSMKVLVGPVTKLESDELLELGVDGVITTEPQEFRFAY